MNLRIRLFAYPTVYDSLDMRELAQIVRAFEQLVNDGKPAALATVVAVGGSSYRRPGARMLIAADGRTWGGISGGCLERDVARRGRAVIDTREPILCRYDTTESPDEENSGDVLFDLGRTPGVTLGCRGVIDLFIERISSDRRGPVPLIAQVIRERVAIRHAMLLRKSASLQTQLGAQILPHSVTLRGNANFERELVDRASERIDRAGDSKYGTVHHVTLTQARSADLWVETLRPPQSLVIFGAGSDVVPLMELSKTLGWHVTIVIGPGSNAARDRFAAADELRVADNDHPSASILPEPHAAVVLMTHDYPRDAQILRSFSGRPIRYLGLLGPRSRSERLLAQSPGSELWNAFFPAGLDLGADNPELIALAILSEIQAVLSDRPGGLLRDRPGPIYPRRGLAT